jgi:hypothetical protein
MSDIDIDFPNAANVVALFPQATEGSVVKDGQLQKHPSGIYLNPIPKDPVTGLSAIPYDAAETAGYFKLDFLTNSVYRIIPDEETLNRCINAEPSWELLLYPELSDELFHLKGHSEVLKEIRPTSLEDLAVVLALIRPGKRHLRGQSRDQIDAEIWKPNQDGYNFKKAHAIAYALVIVVQMNRMMEMNDDG